MSDPIASFDEGAIRSGIGGLARETAEDAVDAPLDEGADPPVNAERYGRTADRGAYRAERCARSLTTTSGNIEVAMPRLEGARFVAAVIERREASVGEAIAEMRLAGASTSRVEDVSEILWGAGVSPGTASSLNEKAFESIEEWRNRPLTCERRRVYVGGIYLKRAWGGSFENVAAMAAVGVNDDGFREAVGAAGGSAESAECRRGFLSWLKSRGLRGARMLAGDKAAGMAGAVAEAFPEAARQRCTVHFYRNVMSEVPKSKRKLVAGKLEAIHAQESSGASGEKALRVVSDLEGMRLKEAAKVVRDGYVETLTYTRFPMEHWRRIRADNAIERLNREARGRTRVVGAFPGGKSALMLVAARLERVADGEWGRGGTWTRPCWTSDHADALQGVEAKCARFLTVPTPITQKTVAVEKREPIPAWPIDWERLKMSHEIAFLRGDLATSSPESYTIDQMCEISDAMDASTAEVEEALRADFNSMTPYAQGRMLGLLKKADPGNYDWWANLLVGPTPNCLSLSKISIVA